MSLINNYEFNNYLLGLYYGSVTMLNVRYEITGNSEMFLQIKEHIFHNLRKMLIK